MSAPENSNFDADILFRVVNPDQGGFSPAFAQAVLKFEFHQRDLSRMDELAQKAQAGELSETEKQLLDSYIRVGHFLSMIKSKARVSLRGTSGVC